MSARRPLTHTSHPRASQAALAKREARLRARIERLFPITDQAIPLPGAAHSYSVALPADPDGPLDQLAAIQAAGGRAVAEPTRSAAHDARRSVAQGIHLPYWALLWPSGLALAEALLASAGERARGERALELGCGLGVTASAALATGMRLWAADCFADALLFCQYNTLRNAGRVPATLLLDWRTEVGRAACLARAPYAVVLAADVLYEAEDQEPLLALVPRLLAPGGVFWLAEPGRRVSQAFVVAALALGWQDTATRYDRIWPGDMAPTTVMVHRFRLPTGATSGRC